jgi:hypothetical protein
MSRRFSAVLELRKYRQHDCAANEAGAAGSESSPRIEILAGIFQNVPTADKSIAILRIPLHPHQCGAIAPPFE